MLDNNLDRKQILKAAQYYCDAFCAQSSSNRIILTYDDLDILCNPNLQIKTLSKTAHVQSLTACLVYHIKNRLISGDKNWLYLFDI